MAQKRKLSKLSPKELIEAISRQYQRQLLDEIEKAEVLLAMQRIPDSGKVLEIALRRLLLQVLPEYVGITRGKIFCSECKEDSEEIDLILYDKRYFPGLVVEDFRSESLSYVSVDTVMGVISVKKTLNRRTLRDGIENLDSVYRLNQRPLTNQLHHDVPLHGMTHKTVFD